MLPAVTPVVTAKIQVKTPVLAPKYVKNTHFWPFWGQNGLIFTLFELFLIISLKDFYFIFEKNKSFLSKTKSFLKIIFIKNISKEIFNFQRNLQEIPKNMLKNTKNSLKKG